MPPTPFSPYVPADARPSEFTARALILGVLLGVVFGVSSLYLVLKVGLTVSASIPVAVISVALFRLLSRFGVRDSTVLENTIVSTAGSAGESIAFGVGVTMPAILILGFDLELTRVMLVAVLGGLLGILMMIPLRRALIVEQHGTLKYPEGTACAEVLKAADPQAGAGRRIGGGAAVFLGFAVGLAYKVANVALKGWKEAPGVVFGPPVPAASVAAEISPELLGVGYIIGPRIASVMCAGGVLTYLVLIPLIKYFGSGLPGPLAPGSGPIAAMGPGDIRSAYVLYIGAGAVTAGGLIALLRALPMIWAGLRRGIADARASTSVAVAPVRTQQDLPLPLVLAGSLLLVAAITLAPPLQVNLLGAALIVLFGFLFVTVSSRLTGEIGSSANPISGMTVATLLLACLIFLALGWSGREHYVAALSIGAIVCIAAANGGTTSQDLKAGFLLGATPRLQQLAILAGALLSALALGPVLVALNESATVYVPVAQVAPGLTTDPRPLTETAVLQGPQGVQDHRRYKVWRKDDSAGGPPGAYLVDESGRAVWLVDPGINGKHTHRPDGTEVRKFDAPKAVLMSYIIKGVLGGELPWGLVLAGVMIALVLELCGVASLPFAVGVYLPLATSATIFIGGLLRHAADAARRRSPEGAAMTETELAAAADQSPGVLLASGYIAGGALAGIVIALTSGVFGALDAQLADWASNHNPFYAGALADGLSLLPFLLLATLLYRYGRRS